MRLRLSRGILRSLPCSGLPRDAYLSTILPGPKDLGRGAPGNGARARVTRRLAQQPAIDPACASSVGRTWASLPLAGSALADAVDWRAALVLGFRV